MSDPDDNIGDYEGDYQDAEMAPGPEAPWPIDGAWVPLDTLVDACHDLARIEDAWFHGGGRQELLDALREVFGAR